MTRERLTDALGALAEVTAALGLAVFATLFLIPGVAAFRFLAEDGPGTLAERLLATSSRVEFPLIESATGKAASRGVLMLRLQELGVAEHVEIVGAGDTASVVLSGTRSAGEVVAAASRVLEQNGYRGVEFSSRRTLDFLEYLQDPTNLRALIPATLTLQALIFIGVGGVLIRLRMPRRPPLGVRAHARAGLWGIAAGLAAFGSSLLIGFLLHAIGLPPEEQTWLKSLLDDRATLLGLAPWILVVVPLSEEVFFRAYVFRFVAGRLGLPAGLVFSSGMFAVIHLNPSGIAIYMAVGLVLAGVYWRTKSLLAPVVGHAAYNGLVLAVALLTSPG